MSLACYSKCLSWPTKLFVFLIFLASSVRAETSPTEKPILAVLELQGEKVPHASLRLWTDLVRTVVIQTLGDAAEVMTAGNQAFLLKENGVDPAQCDADACDVDLLRQLTTDFGFSGTITRLDNGHYLGTLMLYDTASGTALGAAKIAAKSDEELVFVLERNGAHLCHKLPGLLPALHSDEQTSAAKRWVADGTAPAPPSNGAVFVTFTSTPDGAAVFANDIELCPETPCKKKLPIGFYGFRFQLAAHRQTSLEMLVQRGQEPVHVTLQPTYGLLRVSVHPPNARIAVDGEVRDSMALAAGIRVAAGVHEVWVEDPCYRKTGERVVLTEGGFRELRLVAQEEKTLLELDVEDTNQNDIEAQIFVDGGYIGSNANAVPIPVCATSLELRHEHGHQRLALPALQVSKTTRLRVGLADDKTPDNDKRPMEEEATAGFPNRKRARVDAAYERHLESARMHVERHAFAAAIQSYLAALDIHPDASEVHLGLGNAYFESGNPGQALMHLEKARLISPEEPSVYVLLGTVYLSENKKKSAREAFNKYLEIAPKGRFSLRVKKILQEIN